MVGRHRRTLGTIAGALAVVVLAATPALAAARSDPAGNNGTVKIDGKPFDDAPDNEPHPGCVFQVDFYGFDAGDLDAEVTFEAIAPTAGGVVLTDTVPIGEDSHAGGGSQRGLDASRTYDLSGALSGIEPQPNQGWHIRLTVQADGSQGADVKHKVFWVQECAAEAAVAGAEVSAGETAPGSSATTASGAGETTTGSPATVAAALPASVTGAELVAAPAPPTAPATRAAVATPAAQVLGETLTRQPAAHPSVLARTGIGLGLAALALALIAGGVLLLRTRSGSPEPASIADAFS